jgi:hypothetical protein
VAEEVQIAIPEGTGQRVHSGTYFIRIISAVPIVIILYVLSTGPALKLYQRGALPYQVMKIYNSLETLDAYFPQTGKFLNWYVYDVWHCTR